MIFPPIKSTQKPASKKPEIQISRRKARRSEYARTQNAWTKNPCKRIKQILDTNSAATPPEQQAMEKFWETAMTREINNPAKEIKFPKTTLDIMWKPVTADEITSNYPELTSSPGPDGITSKQLRAIPLPILVRIFNFFLASGKLPLRLLKVKTTLIPKKENANNPGDYRPITVQTILTRSFNKVLASRILKNIKFDNRQRAFLPIDGYAHNTFELDMILRYHRQKFKPLFMASIDLSKAFDSVSHRSLKETLIVMEFFEKMINYIIDSYERSTTLLSCYNWISKEIHPTSGVKQEDPLSPLLFNMIIDHMVQLIPSEVGLMIDNIKYNAIMFADDILLFASTEKRLQKSLDNTTDFLADCGLAVNSAKSFTISIRNIPKKKKSVIDGNTKFIVKDKEIPALKREDEFRYLGIPYTPEGCLITKPDEKYKKILYNLTRAPLKPQQRLFALRVIVLPGLYHLLTLGGTTISGLNKIDALTRKEVRKWLALPRDTLNAYIHANMKDGGLSIPSVRWLMPIHRASRIVKIMKKNPENDTSDHVFLQDEFRRASRRLMDGSD